MRYEITIDRFSGVAETTKENWKDLISALVLCGFTVHADEGEVIFETGDGEKVQEVK